MTALLRKRNDFSKKQLARYRIWTIGDDIAWMRVDSDGSLWAVNPEAGCFGVAPGTNSKTNPNAMAMIQRDTIFTNVVLKPDKTVWWEGGDGQIPHKGIDWQGKQWKPGMLDANGNYINGAHPNSRFTAPIANCPSVSHRLEHHHGVPISAIIFGGRRAHLAPLVYESFNWQHGVFMGATMASRTYKMWIMIIIICCGIWGCSPNGDDARHTIKDMPATTLKGFHLLETVDGKPQWELSGKNADIKQNAVNLNGITCIFFHPQTEEAVLKVKANKGKLETDSRMIELVGEVVAEDIIAKGAASAKGAAFKNIFYSSRLIWDATRLVLISPEEITIQMNGAIFKADTLTINPATEVVEARGVRIKVVSN